MITKNAFPFLMLTNGMSNAPLYQQLYTAIRDAILRGELAPGLRLPASRPLAGQLGIARITVVNAYEQLLAEGYLTGKVGAGTFVAAELPEMLLQTASRNVTPPTTLTRPTTLQLTAFGKYLTTVPATRTRLGSSFRPFENGVSDTANFPFAIWARLAAQIQRQPPRELLGYGDSQGYRPLREAIATYLASARGVVCTAEQVIIVAGAQQAFDLIARIFLASKDVAWIEDPVFPQIRHVFASTGAKIVPVPVDEEGFNLAAATRRKTWARLVYVTPSHQYPLGYTMSLARRLALLEWAAKKHAWIIEDDYNSEFRYAGRPLASLQGLDRAGCVLYVGTFSKTIFPALRLGCLVAPPALVSVLTAARALTDLHSSLIDQAILAEFINGGYFARHIRRMRTLYETRQHILVQECQKHLSEWLTISPAAAGRHLIGWLKEGLSDTHIAQLAAQHNVSVTAVSSLSAHPQPRGGLVMGYTAFDEKQIRAGVKKLREVFLAMN